MKLRHLHCLLEDRTSEITDEIIANLGEFLAEVRDTGFSNWKTGQLQHTKPVRWTIAFAGGDGWTRETFEEDLDNEDFHDFLDEQFPMPLSVQGVAWHELDGVNVDIRFNPLYRDHLLSLDPEQFRSRVEMVMDHELRHLHQPAGVRKSRIPMQDLRSRRQYYRMPDEIDANLDMIANYYKRSQDKPTTIMQLLAKADPRVRRAYRSPKWRKKLTQGLIRRGVVLRSWK